MTGKPLQAIRFLWDDRKRVLASFVGAWILWYLIGQRVTREEEIHVEVRWVGLGDALPRSGLVILVPDNLVVLGVEPRHVLVKVSGMTEQIAKLDRNLRGVYDLPPDFCDEEDPRSATLVVHMDFEFPAVEAARGLTVKDSGTVTVQVSRRASTTITLEARNVAFGSDSLQSLPPEEKVSFQPSFIEVTGPRSEIEMLRAAPERLKIPLAGSVEDYRQAKTVSLRHLIVVDETGAVRDRARVTSVEKSVEIQIRPTRAYKTVVLKGMSVAYTIPEKARRSNVDPANPVTLNPSTLDIQVKVPESYFAAGGTEEDLRRELQLVVDVGEMEPGLQLARLPVYCLRLPEGAQIEFSGTGMVDVEWNEIEGS